MSISALHGSTNATTSKLVKLVSGEYTAASVNADPTDAAKLSLVRQKDGNYGTMPPLPQIGGEALAKSSVSVQMSLESLKFGGA